MLAGPLPAAWPSLTVAWTQRAQDTGDALLTGFGDMQDEYANLNEERSQFKLHYFGGKMINEKVGVGQAQ